MLGFSVSIGQRLNESYILSMVSQGYDTIFTSLQIPEEDDQFKLSHLGELCQLLSQYSITFIIDVNPSLLNHHFYSLLDQFSNGEFVIRIDDQLNVNLILDIQKRGYQCCINASTITHHILSTIYSNPNIRTLIYCHNYYPRPDTALSLSSLQQQNNLIHLFDPNAKIFAFIPGTNLRGPLYKGLPTIENHRHEHAFQAVHELQLTGINTIVIADNGLEINLAKQLYQIFVQHHFVLHINNVENNDNHLLNLLYAKHHVRIDSPEHVLRSQTSRLMVNQKITPIGIEQRLPGDITIDNHLNGRYEGELQIIKTSLPGHSNINRLARICKQDLPFLKIMQPGDTFEFICLKET